MMLTTASDVSQHMGISYFCHLAFQRFRCSRSRFLFHKKMEMDFILCGSARSLEVISLSRKRSQNRSSHQPQDPDSPDQPPYRHPNPNSRMPPSYHQDTTNSHLQQRIHHNSPHTTLTEHTTTHQSRPGPISKKLKLEEKPKKFSPVVLQSQSRLKIKIAFSTISGAQKFFSLQHSKFSAS